MSSTPTDSASSSPNSPALILTSSTPTSAKRACDACRRRKVKCDGSSLCHNCSSSELACTYNAIPQRKGPKGSRANVMSELRNQNRRSALSGKRRARLFGLSATGGGNGMQIPPPCAPGLAPTPGLLTQELLVACIDFFFTNMYPSCLILHRGKLQAQARLANRDLDTYCLLTSLCAFMMLQPGMPVLGDLMGQDGLLGTNVMSGAMLMEETIRCRKGYDHVESPTLANLATSYFLFGCYFVLDIHTKAWFHLREATTLACILGMNKEETYMTYDVIDSSRRRRLYWLLFVAERSYALQRHRPLTLQATIAIPTADDDPTEPAPSLTGFIHIVTLFKPFDDKFVALWNKTRSDCSPAYLTSLQKHLSDALPAYLNSTKSQAAELRISQQWLHNIIWQLSISNGSLSSESDNPSMTFRYPLEISRGLIAMTTGFSHYAMAAQGVGFVEKLFDVACSLTDVFSLSRPPTDPFAPSPTDYVTQFLSVLSSLRNSGDSRFLDLLLTKMHDVLPRLANPTLQTLPEPSSDMGTTAGGDIFDGFGIAGMGVSSPQPQQLQQQGYEAKCCNEKPYEIKHFQVKREDIMLPGLQDQMLHPHTHLPQQQHHQPQPHTHLPQQQHHQPQPQQHCQHCQPTHHSIPLTPVPQQQSQLQQPLGQVPLPAFQDLIQQALKYQSIHLGMDFDTFGAYAFPPAPTRGDSTTKSTSSIGPWV